MKEIFTHWNSKKIIIHKSLKDFQSHIKARLDNGYTVKNIIEAIDNYSAVLKSDDHFWTHKWGLKDFLIRKGALDKFLTINNPLDNYRKDQAERDQQPLITVSDDILKAAKEHLEKNRARTTTEH